MGANNWSWSGQVLILVLMEYGLWRSAKLFAGLLVCSVLILVLMEYGLWHSLDEIKDCLEES